MHTSQGAARQPSAGLLRRLTIIALIVFLAMQVGGTASFAQEHPIDLRTADSFAVLAGSTITNTGPTTITGDVGLHPGTAVTGFASVTLHGEQHIDDAVAEQAKVDLVTAYDEAAGRTPVTTVATELGGQELTGGVYDSADGTFQITGTLTLDAEGVADTVWVFQAASTLITATDSDVNLVNGADPCNVYWQVGSDATLGTNSALAGTVMALSSITLTTGASVQGRVLARNAAVTMDTNTITNAGCTTPVADDDATDEDAPVDDTPVEDAPVDDTPVENGAPTEEADEAPSEDTPTGEGTPTGDDTPTGGDTATGGDTPSGGDTTSQIVEVPAGSVAAGGGGSDASTSGLWFLVAGGFVLLAGGGAAGVITRRRTGA